MPDIDQSAVTAIELCIAAAAHDPAGKLPSGWELTAWGKGDLHGNQAIVAAQTGSPTYAVAIRGTVIDNILNWIMDFEVFEQEPFPGMTGGANIAKGSMDGLNDLLAMKGQDGQALPTFVGTLLAQGDSVLVTGHSLGGNLASVLAPYLALQHPGTALTACTFAAPTAGNAAFASQYDSLFPGSSRYYNTIDAVPMAWNDVDGICALFPSPGPGIPTDSADLIRAFQAALLKSEESLNSYYTPTNDSGTPLPNTPTAGLSFDQELGLQHASTTYLALLGG
jgi:hypothetical protein